MVAETRAATETVTLETVLALAGQLSASDQLRLIARLTESLAEREASPLPSVAGETTPRPAPTLRGMLADLGPAPSAEEIDEVRREMWANFPRDIE